jgi:hypothetical protein
MNATRDPAEDNSLNLFLFSVGGVHFGADAAQIAGMAPLTGDDGDKPAWLHEVLEFGARPVTYREPVILDVGTVDDSRWRVVVDAVEDITSACPYEIHPLPAPVESHALRKGLWGVLPRGGRMILLLDFRLLLSRQGPLFPTLGGC